MTVEGYNDQLTMSSRAILEAQAPLPEEEAPRILRERRPVDHGPMVSSALSDGEDDGSEDSMDDNEVNSADIDPDEGPVQGPVQAPPGPPPDPLLPHGLRWTVVGPDVILADPRPIVRIDTQLRWSLIGLEQFGSAASDIQIASQYITRRTPIHYFMLSYPVDSVHSIVTRTNNSILNEHSRQTRFTVQSFFKVLGILYGMTMHHLPNRREYFQDNQSKMTPHFNYGRFMDCSHFEHFIQHLSWSEVRAEDKWSSVRDFITAFNHRRIATVIPSDKLTIDESMSANRTTKTIAHNVPAGLPHQAKIARKPEGVGVEIRCLVDGRSEIMLQLEIQESAADMQRKKYVSTGEKPSTAGVLRLVEPWFGSGRMVFGDSAFASVHTAIQLKKKNLYFSGMVKTGHKYFPKKYLQDLDIQLRTGSSVYLTTVKDDVPLLAVGWWDKALKCLVATGGTNLPATPHLRVRYILQEDGTSKRIEKATTISAVPHEYFSYAQKVDVHNHRRQGILAMERNISTRSWAFRIVSTVLGMIMVDAYMMYLSEQALRQEVKEGGEQELTFYQFADTVSYSLATNTICEQSLRHKRPAPSNGSDDIKDAPNPFRSHCRLTRINDFVDTTDKKRKHAHLHCKVCSKQTTSCCARCSVPGQVVAVCSFDAKREIPCFWQHVATIQGL